MADSSKHTSAGISGEHSAKLMKIFEKTQQNIAQLEKSVDFAVGVLIQCGDKFKDLHSQMTEINEEVVRWSTQYNVETAVCSSNSMSVEKSDEFQKIAEKVERNLLQAEKSVEFSKGVLVCESSNKFKELQLQVTEFKSIVEKLASKSQKSPGTHELLKDKNSKELEQEESVTTPDAFGKCKETRDLSEQETESRTKKQKISHERSTINPETTHQCKTSSLFERIKSSELHASKSGYASTIDGAEVSNTESEEMGIDALHIALRETEGILSLPDFHTFLVLSDEVDDPVQLAKISFTKDLKRLQEQLVSFYHSLRNINDIIQRKLGESEANRNLEHKLQILISAFKTQVDPFGYLLSLGENFVKSHGSFQFYQSLYTAVK